MIERIENVAGDIRALVRSKLNLPGWGENTKNVVDPLRHPRASEIIREEIEFQNQVYDYAANGAVLGSVVSVCGAIGLAIKRVIEAGDASWLIHQSYYVVIPVSMVVGAVVGGASFALVNKGIEMIKDLKRRTQVDP